MEQGPGWAYTDHLCAIETTGGIHCWGSDLFGQATVPWRVLGCVVLALVLGFGAIAVGVLQARCRSVPAAAAGTGRADAAAKP